MNKTIAVNPSNQSTIGQRRIPLKIGVIIIAITVVLGAVAIISLLNSTPSRTNGGIQQVIVKVSYYGSWQGAYGSTGSIVSWSGTGSYSVTLTRNSNIWVVSANAQKMDDSRDTLTISIFSLDGTMMQSASTNAAYGIAQVSAAMNG